jgi:hypothetical protein
MSAAALEQEDAEGVRVFAYVTDEFATLKDRPQGPVLSPSHQFVLKAVETAFEGGILFRREARVVRPPLVDGGAREP